MMMAIYIALLYTMKPEGMAEKTELKDVHRELKARKEKRIGVW